MNYVRLRVWNDPTTSFDARDYCNAAHTIEMAERIKKAGMKLLIDFHYSDTWADLANQTKPAAWKDYSYTQLVQAVYDYTADVLKGLNEVGAYPDMVQIGNEISGGMLWDDGCIDSIIANGVTDFDVVGMSYYVSLKKKGNGLTNPINLCIILLLLKEIDRNMWGFCLIYRA